MKMMVQVCRYDCVYEVGVIDMYMYILCETSFCGIIF